MITTCFIKDTKEDNKFLFVEKSRKFLENTINKSIDKEKSKVKGRKDNN